MTIKPGGACVTIKEALLVLEATGNPLLDYTILKNDDPNFIERVIRNRVRELGLLLDSETPCYPPGPSTIDGYGVWPVRDYVEGVVASYAPKPVAKIPFPADPPRTGWPKAGEVTPVSHADPYQYGRYEKPASWA